MAAGLVDHTEHDLVSAIRDIDKAIAATRDSLAFVTNPAVLGDAVLELHAVTARLDGLRVELAGQAVANGVPQTAGVRTLGQFVGSRSNSSPQQASMDVSDAKWLAGFAVFGDAYRGGLLTKQHLRVLKRLDTARSNRDLHRDQTILVDAAVGVESFDNFMKVVEYWLSRNDPDGEEPRDQLMSNSVRFRKGSGGRGTIIAELDAVSFKAAKTMINHATNKLRTDATETGFTSLDQDRMAGLMSLLTRGFAREDGSMPVPLFNIVMSQTVAEWAINKLTNPDADHGPVPVDPFHVDGRCEFLDGTHVHPLLVVALGGLWKFAPPEMRRYVMDAKSRIIDYSFNARIPPEHLRTAVMVQHRGACTTNGCDAPEHWIQIDHDTPHSKGGPTAFFNLKPMCCPDNQAKGTGPNYHQRPPPPTNNNPDPDDDPDEPDVF